jgi:16S rRNA (guanine1516-N2)-methyltransferase
MIQCGRTKGNQQTIHQVIPTSPVPVSPPLLVLTVDPHGCADRARQLAHSLNIPIVGVPPPDALVLRLGEQRLELYKPGDPDLPRSLWVDFDSTTARRRSRHPGKELLIQAAKVRKTVQPLLIDATAGLGRDGFLLATAGFRVLMIECNPVVAALLDDGLRRARQMETLAPIAARIHFLSGNALDHLPALTEQPEVLYLDPMFPERSKTAKVKQGLRLLQLLNQKTEQPEQLLRAALSLQAKKVVVKRPLKGPFLAGRPPSYSLKGKAVRFDVYLGSGKEG